MKGSYKDVIDLTIMAIIYFKWLYKKWKGQSTNIFIINTLMYIYLTGVLYFTLMPIITSLPALLNHPYISMSLVPFEDLAMGRGDVNRQIILNIIMMIPFGMLYPLYRKCSNKNCSILRCLLLTLLFSLFIELTQPLISGFRSSDITDIITNMVGGLLGYLFYLISRPVSYRLLRIGKPKSMLKSINKKGN